MAPHTTINKKNEYAPTTAAVHTYSQRGRAQNYRQLIWQVQSARDNVALNLFSATHAPGPALQPPSVFIGNKDRAPGEK